MALAARATLASAHLLARAAAAVQGQGQQRVQAPAVAQGPAVRLVDDELREHLHRGQSRERLQRRLQESDQEGHAAVEAHLLGLPDGERYEAARGRHLVHRRRVPQHGEEGRDAAAVREALRGLRGDAQVPQALAQEEAQLQLRGLPGQRRLLPVLPRVEGRARAPGQPGGGCVVASVTRAIATVCDVQCAVCVGLKHWHCLGGGEV